MHSDSDVVILIKTNGPFTKEKFTKKDKGVDDNRVGTQ